MIVFVMGHRVDAKGRSRVFCASETVFICVKQFKCTSQESAVLSSDVFVTNTGGSVCGQELLIKRQFAFESDVKF